MMDNLSYNEKALELFEKTERMEKQKKFDQGEIVDICSRIIELEPKYAPAYVKRSKYRQYLGNYASALEDINIAIEMGFESAEAYYLRASCYAIIGNNESARINDIKAALRLDPRHAKANSEMGHYYYDKDNKKDAYKHFTESIDNKGSDPLAFFKRGIINMDNGRYEHAIVDFLDSQTCNPRNSLVYYLRANCYYEIGALDRALRDYENVLLSERLSPDPYYKLGCVYYDKGDFDNSIKNFDMLISLLPDSETGYYSRGIAWMAKNELANAIADFEKALSINDADANTCYLLSQAYLGQGNEALGKRYYEQALSLGYKPEEN